MPGVGALDAGLAVAVGVVRPGRALGDRAADVPAVDAPAEQAEQRRGQGQRRGRRDHHRDTGGGAQTADEGDARGVEARQGHRHGRCGDQHGAPAGGHRPAGRLGRVRLAGQQRAVAGGEEERVVDAHAQAHHHGQGRRGPAEVDAGGEQSERREAGGHPEHPGDQRQAGGHHTAEADQQHQHGGAQTDQLRGPVRALGLGELAERVRVLHRHAVGPQRGHRPVQPGQVGGVEGGRVAGEADGHRGGGAVGGQRARSGQRVRRVEHVRQGAQAGQRGVQRRPVVGERAVPGVQHHVGGGARAAVGGEQVGAGLGGGAGQREVVGEGAAPRRGSRRPGPPARAARASVPGRRGGRTSVPYGAAGPGRAGRWAWSSGGVLHGGGARVGTTLAAVPQPDVGAVLGDCKEPSPGPVGARGPVSIDGTRRAPPPDAAHRPAARRLAARRPAEHTDHQHTDQQPRERTMPETGASCWSSRTNRTSPTSSAAT